MNMDSMIKIGPVGSSVGTACWDEKGNSDIAQIFIWYDDDQVCSLQFQYRGERISLGFGQYDYKLFLSERHGPEATPQFVAVKFGPCEDLIRISGYSNSTTGIVSVLFVTNSAEKGPYGARNKGDDRAFSFNLGREGFGGFHGSVKNSGTRKLSSLGVYLRSTQL